MKIEFRRRWAQTWLFKTNNSLAAIFGLPITRKGKRLMRKDELFIMVNKEV